MAPAMKYRNRPWVGFKWLFFRTGPGATNHFEAGGFILLATKLGRVKKTEIPAFAHIKSGGIIAINLDDGDEVVVHSEQALKPDAKVKVVTAIVRSGP